MQIILCSQVISWCMEWSIMSGVHVTDAAVAPMHGQTRMSHLHHYQPVEQIKSTYMFKEPSLIVTNNEIQPWHIILARQNQIHDISFCHSRTTYMFIKQLFTLTKKSFKQYISSCHARFIVGLWSGQSCRVSVSLMPQWLRYTNQDITHTSQSSDKTR